MIFDKPTKTSIIIQFFYEANQKTAENSPFV